MRLKLTHGALVCAFVAAPAVGAFAQTPAASADHSAHHQMAQERQTTVEFKTATRFPGITLQPGSYVFKMRGTNGKQHFVDVYSSDGTQKIATLLTVDYPTAATAGTTTVLYPSSSTVRAWYFPGEPVGRAFVYSQDEARTLYTSTQTPVLWASYDPNDTTTVFEVNTYDQNVAGQVADAAKAVGNAAVKVAKAIGNKAEDVWDDVTDNASLVNPTDSRKMAERHLDAAEKTYDNIDERLNDAQMASLVPMRAHLEALEDAFEKNDASWMTHYTATIAALDRLAPNRPVGTSGGTVMLDTTTQAELGTLRAQLNAFHNEAMGR